MPPYPPSTLGRVKVPNLPALVHETLSSYRHPAIVPEITSETHFRDDLHCDDIDMVCIRQAIEERFGDMTDAAFSACETVGELERVVFQDSMTGERA